MDFDIFGGNFKISPKVRILQKLQPLHDGRFLKWSHFSNIQCFFFRAFFCKLKKLDLKRFLEWILTCFFVFTVSFIKKSNSIFVQRNEEQRPLINKEFETRSWNKSTIDLTTWHFITILFFFLFFLFTTCVLYSSAHNYRKRVRREKVRELEQQATGGGKL